MLRSLHRALFVVVLAASTASAVALGCGSDAGNATWDDADHDGSAPPGPTGIFGQGNGDGTEDQDGSGGPNNQGPLVIAPADIVLVVTKNLNTGSVDAAPLAYQATFGGVAVNPRWNIDHGELGSLDATSGVFTPAGTVGGKATVTASYGNVTAGTTLTVKIRATQSGGVGYVDGGVLDAGAGGFGGVGGKGPGGPTTSEQQTALGGSATAPIAIDGGTYYPNETPPAGVQPATAKDFEWLYPYDLTVWPKRMIPPLLQWRSTHAHETVAVSIRLVENNYEFVGTYAFPPVGAIGFTDDDRSRQPLDETAWKAATSSNTGGADYLRAEIRILTQDGTVYGPITENWTIASGMLKGTVYYNTYESTLNNRQGAVLSIKPGALAPNLAIPARKGQCHVCHSVSADGRTLFVQDSNYDYGSAYDMTKDGALIESYHAANADGGTTNSGKFTFSGVYPDGTMAMSCSSPDPNWHHYTGNANLFTRAGGNPYPTTGLTDLVKEATTPAFSPDGRHVVFGLGTLQSGADAGGAATNSKALMGLDFNCGQAPGSVTCTSLGVFSSPKTLFTTSGANRYVAWPSFTPDAKAVLFQHTLHPAPTGSVIYTHGDDHGGTGGALAQLLYTDVSGSGQPVTKTLCALNGLKPGCEALPIPYLPEHATYRKNPADGSQQLYEAFDDTRLNFEPTVNPVASGGYYWVVFTSRRRYGNLAAGYPYDGFDGQNPQPNFPIPKKLWVAAIDATTGAVDPSHPAFYLPGQELVAGNMRGFWVVDPCQQNGVSCETGDECCTGFCRPGGTSGALVCSDKPVGACVQEFESCKTDAECCDAPSGYKCIAGRCTKPAAPPPPLPK